MARSRRTPSAHHHTSAPPAHTAPAPHAQQQHQPQVTNIYVQRHGGGGSGMLGTMAAVAGGSVLGHGISNYLYGGSGQQAPAQPAEAQELAAAAQQQQHPCSSELVGYAKCMENMSAEQCSWAWDYFQQCQKEKQPQQPN